MLSLFALKGLIALEALRLEFSDKLKDEQGQGLIEYVLIIFLFAIGLVVALEGFGGALNLKYADIAQNFPVAP